jgi:hypothetical protein
MKKFMILISFWMVACQVQFDNYDFGECTLGTYDGFADVRTQEDMEVLRGYTRMNDSLSIDCRECVSLEPLHCLTETEGFLEVENGDLLESLEGLNDLKTIGDYLAIQRNRRLTDTSALGSLNTIGNYIQIKQNGELVTINGFENLISLENEETGGLYIDDNYKLKSLTGFRNMESMLLLFVANNAALENLDDLESLKTINEWIQVSDNRSMSDCNVCDFLGQIENEDLYLGIFDNEDDDCTPVPDGC